MTLTTRIARRRAATRSSTPGTTLRRVVVFPTTFVVGGTLAYSALLAFEAPEAGVDVGVGVGVETGAAAPERATALVARHDCWSGAAPSDVEVPGHVVTTWRGRTRYSSHLVGPALAHVFETPVPGMTVHAFCR